MPRTGIVFRPIVRKQPNPDRIPRRFRDLLNKVAGEIQEELEEPIKDWKHKVKFNRFIRYGYPKTLYLRVSTTDKVYNFQDQGTKAHRVEPKHAKALHWTTPEGEQAFSKGHRVSGVKAKKWTERTKRKYRPRIKELADRMMAEIAANDL